MKRAYKYRIYPTEEQKKYFSVVFAANRWFWNYALDQIQKAYKEEGKHLSAQYNVSRELPRLKKEEPTSWIKQADAMSFIYTAQNLDAAFKSFFRKQGGFPKYKKAKYDNSFSIQVGKDRQGIISWRKEQIRIGKAGLVNIVLHKKFRGEMKTITVSKKSYDYYEVAILVDDDFIKPEVKQDVTYEGTIGIDLGVKKESNAVLSDGTKFKGVDCDRLEKRLKRLKKKLSKKMWIKTGEKKYSERYKKEVEVKRPSKNYIKLKNRIAKIEDTIKRKRSYNTHQISSFLTKNKDINTICVENLDVKKMSQTHFVAIGVQNANIAELKRQIEYKSDWNGKNFVVVDRFYASSQLCSKCGYKYDGVKNLSVRKWTCPECGEVHDRDVNAARNIKEEGYRIITKGK